MKKILAILAMALVVSEGALAASARIEWQDADGVDGSPNQQSIVLGVKESFTKYFAGDVGITSTSNNSNGGIGSTRAEIGGTGSYPVAGPFGVYTRLGIGQKYTSTKNFGYYSVEPGVTADIGYGFNAKIGYRFRDAFDANNNVDTTRTWRAGLDYSINKDNAIGVGYDYVRGDTNQNVWKVNYTRGF